MPLAARIPPNSTLEHAIRIFLAFESDFANGTDGLEGMLAAGHLRPIDEAGDPIDLPDELAEIAAEWRGPRSGNDQLILGGEFARRIEERDYSDFPFPHGLVGTVDVIATGRPTTATRRFSEYNLMLSCRSTALHAASPAERDSQLQQDFADAANGSTWAAQDLAKHGLRQLAVFDQRPAAVSIDGARIDVPILGLRGRFLHGASEFHDQSATWVDDFAAHATRRPYEWAVRQTIDDFVEAATPTLESARRNPSRFRAEMVAMGRQYPWFFGPERPSPGLDRLINRHLAAFLSMIDRFPGQLQYALEVDPRVRREDPFTFDEVRNTFLTIRQAFYRPDIANELGK